MMEDNSNTKHKRPVVQLTLDGKFVREWESEKAAARGINTSQANISYCCSRHYHHYSAGGFRWLFKEVYESNDEISLTFPKRKTRARAILQYTKEGEFVREWESITAIRDEKGYLAGTISTCCQLPKRSAYGYKWRYKE